MTSAAVIYCRISKDDRDDRLGVQRQEKLCRDLAKSRGLSVVDVLVDNDTSAFRQKRRPAFEGMVDLLKSGTASAVVAYHPDRLYRRLADLERLVTLVEATGAQVHTVAAGDVDLSTSSGRQNARILGAVAQGESERMGERLRAKTDELAAAGKPPGGRPPYGYSKGYVVNPDEAEGVRYIARRILEGKSLHGLARELDALGIKTREGRPWHFSTVRTVVLNPAVAGLRVHRREVAGPGQWEAILERSQWEEVRAVLTDPARKRQRPPQKYLLSGLVYSETGDRLNGAPDGRGGKMHRTYMSKAQAVTSLQIKAEPVEELVTAAVLAVLDDAELPVAEEREGSGAEVVEIEAEMAQLARLRGDGTITLAEWMAAREPLQARLEAARAESGRTARPPAELAALRGPGAVRKAWPDLDLSARRAIIGAVVKRVEILPAANGRWTPIEDRVRIVRLDED